MWIALCVILVFRFGVVIHELGHFLVCKWLGVRGEKFAVGFGKELFGFEWKGTRWSFCLLPLGGYVKPAGEELEETTGAPDEFFGQTWYRRIAIALAGPVMNYVLAFTCFFLLVFFLGQPHPFYQPVIGEVVTGYPAQTAGLEKGDKILAINGKQVGTWEEAAKIIHLNPEKPIDMLVQRVVEGNSLNKIAAVVPKKDLQREIGVIGISPLVEMQKLGLLASIEIASQQTVFWTVLTLKYLGDAIVASSPSF